VEVTADKSILVIDDDPIFLSTTKAVLESHGYKVETAQNGEEGMARMREEPPDLVLLDVMMSWLLEGVTISRDMMDDRELSRIPIMMVTSIRSSEHRGMFPQDEYLHISSWLDKPCSPDRLISEVETTLARYERHRGE